MYTCISLIHKTNIKRIKSIYSVCITNVRFMLNISQLTDGGQKRLAVVRLKSPAVIFQNSLCYLHAQDFQFRCKLGCFLGTGMAQVVPSGVPDRDIPCPIQ